MKKKDYKNLLLKNEFKLVEFLNDNQMAIFETQKFSRLLNIDKTKTYNLIKRLIKNKVIQRIENGKYIVPSLCNINEVYQIATKIKSPSYISFWTALSYYGFTEQVPRTIYICSIISIQKKIISNHPIIFIKLNSGRFFGYTEIDNMIIAEKEKAIIDSLLFPKFAGGIEEISKCLYNSWKQINKKNLIEYALKMNNKSLLKRLGFLINFNNLKHSYNIECLLLKKIDNSFSKLDPSLQKKGKYNQKWKIINNVGAFQ